MLKQRALAATLWSSLDAFIREGLAFGVSIALARLVSPEEFGTVALLSLFAGIATVFVNSGFSSALIQKQDVDHTDESTVFWFNLAMGLAVSLLLWAAAPAIAAFFTQPILVPLTGLLALTVFVSALGSIHGTLLTKQLDFRTQMKVRAVATTVSGAIAIAMAWRGLGIWALATQTLAAACVTTLLLWYWRPWRPALVFSRNSARRLFGYGGYLMGSGMLDVAYTRIYTLFIGKLFGVLELGMYNRAENTKQLPAGVVTDILAQVAFPIFSTAAGDTRQLRRGVQLAMRGIMLLNVPMMLGLAAVADPLVLTLFGPHWLPAAPIMQVLCLGGIFWPLHVINLNVLLAQGHSHLFFRLEVAKKVLGLLFLVTGAYFGVMGMAWSQVAFGPVAFIINAYYSERFLGYGVLAQTRDLLSILAAASTMAALTYWAGLHVNLVPFAKLLTLVAVGGVSYALLVWGGRLAALQDVIEVIKSRRGSSPSMGSAA